MLVSQKANNSPIVFNKVQPMNQAKKRHIRNILPVNKMPIKN